MLFIQIRIIHLSPPLQLWHGTNAVKSICLGDVGFDVRRAHKHGMRQAFLDAFRVGGHIYGHGSYFAEFAIYSHWWFSRSQSGVDDKGADHDTLLLVQVFTGRSKDYGPSWAPDLVVEPPGYHSVTGTESDQKVLPVVSTIVILTHCPTCVFTSSLPGCIFVVIPTSMLHAFLSP